MFDEEEEFSTELGQEEWENHCLDMQRKAADAAYSAEELTDLAQQLETTENP